MVTIHYITIKSYPIQVATQGKVRWMINCNLNIDSQFEDICSWRLYVTLIFLIGLSPACTRPVQDQASQNLRMDGGGADEVLPLSEMLLTVVDCWKRESQSCFFFSRDIGPKSLFMLH